MEDLIDIYNNFLISTSKTMKEVIEKNIEIESKEVLTEKIEEIFKKSSHFIAEKWVSGKKHMRSKYILDAFKEKYPKEAISLSLLIDAQINILDDLFDETLTPENKFLYIIELGRLLSLSNYSKLLTKKEIRELLKDYFLKIAIIGISENIIKNIAKNNPKDMKKYVKFLYDIKSTDIDFYIELPLIFCKFKDKEEKDILNVGRIFRALTIIKKDILDYSHDTKIKQETPYILLRKFGKESLTEKIKEILSSYISSLSIVKSENKIVKNLKEMSLKECKEIENLVLK